MQNRFLKLEGLRTASIIVIGIVVILAIGIPFKIVSDFHNYIYESQIIEFKTIILIGLLITSILGVSLVRQLENPLLKSFLYFVMGFASFWLVGALYYSVYVLSAPMNTNYEILSKSILTTTIFALINAVTILVALIDGKKNGILFGSMGIGVVIFYIVFMKMEFTNFMLLLLIILAVLWAMIPILWIKIFSDYIDYCVPLTIRIPRILKGALLTMLPYLIIGFFTNYLYFGNIEMKNISYSFLISEITTGISLFIFLIGLLYVLTNFILVISISSLFDLALNVFNLKKKIAIDGTIKYVQLRKMKNSISQLDLDPFEDIIKEMRFFRKEFVKGKINRFVAAQKIGAFRENVDIIYDKHKKGSKDMALQILKQIEKESEFAFK